MKPKKKPLTAEQRTISIFTGKTDAEDKLACDGSLPAHKYDELTMQPRPKWNREGDRWLTDRPFNASIEVTKSANRPGVYVYRVMVAGAHVGNFENICEAADAAEPSKRRAAS